MKRIFNFNETSLNIQNGGAHSTNVKILSITYLFSPPILMPIPPMLKYSIVYNTYFSPDFDQICVKIHCL